jgi:hypothetical protein
MKIPPVVEMVPGRALMRLKFTFFIPIVLFLTSIILSLIPFFNAGFFKYGIDSSCAMKGVSHQSGTIRKGGFDIARGVGFDHINVISKAGVTNKLVL